MKSVVSSEASMKIETDTNTLVLMMTTVTCRVLIMIYVIREKNIQRKILYASSENDYDLACEAIWWSDYDILSSKCDRKYREMKKY